MLAQLSHSGLRAIMAALVDAQDERVRLKLEYDQRAKGGLSAADADSYRQIFGLLDRKIGELKSDLEKK